jgi:hypothetical protein
VSERAISGLGCPTCGGDVAIADGMPHGRCRHCGKGFAVVGDRGTPRWMVLEQIDSEQARALFRRWLGSSWKHHPQLRSGATIEEQFLAWFPFVRVQVDVVGALFGTKRVRRNNQTVAERRELLIEQAHDRTIPAAATEEFGMAHADLSGDTIWPFDQAKLALRGMVFGVQGAPDQLADQVVRDLLEQASNDPRLDRVEFKQLESMRRRVSVVHYPYWVFRYTFRDRMYQTIVDAQSGQVWTSSAPGNDIYRASALTIGSAIAAGVINVGLRLSGSFEDFGPIALAAAIGLGAYAWGWRSFRQGGLIEEGAGRFAAPTSGLHARVLEFIRRGGTR